MNRFLEAVERRILVEREGALMEKLAAEPRPRRGGKRPRIPRQRITRVVSLRAAGVPFATIAKRLGITEDQAVTAARVAKKKTTKEKHT